MKTEKKTECEVKMSFEEAMARLEEIVRFMESGATNLDLMVKNFEEGQQLVKFCSKKLLEVERKVEILSKSSNGEVVAEPFDEDLE